MIKLEREGDDLVLTSDDQHAELAVIAERLEDTEWGAAFGATPFVDGLLVFRVTAPVVEGRSATLFEEYAEVYVGDEILGGLI